MAVLHYRDLVSWQRAMDLVEQVYRKTQSFPREETYGLTNQLRRAAVSIASNIAEGQGRGVGQAFAQYLRIARGSIQEVETQLMIAQRLDYLNEANLNSLLDLSAETSRVVTGLARSLESD